MKWFLGSRLGNWVFIGIVITVLAGLVIVSDQFDWSSGGGGGDYRQGN